jgi:hypothetical protein
MDFFGFKKSAKTDDTPLESNDTSNLTLIQKNFFNSFVYCFTKFLIDRKTEARIENAPIHKIPFSYNVKSYGSSFVIGFLWPPKNIGVFKPMGDYGVSLGHIVDFYKLYEKIFSASMLPDVSETGIFFSFEQPTNQIIGQIPKTTQNYLSLIKESHQPRKEQQEILKPKIYVKEEEEEQEYEEEEEHVSIRPKKKRKIADVYKAISPQTKKLFERENSGLDFY